MGYIPEIIIPTNSRINYTQYVLGRNCEKCTQGMATLMSRDPKPCLGQKKRKAWDTIPLTKGCKWVGYGADLGISYTFSFSLSNSDSDTDILTH